MSAYPGVRARIVEIIEATTTDDVAAGVTGAFRHAQSGIQDGMGNRWFQIAIASGHLELPGVASIKGRINATLRIGILYHSNVKNLGDLDAAIGSDAENIILQLLTADWQTSTTGIELIGARDGGETSMEFEVSEEEGAIVVSFDVPIVYRRGVETN